MRIAFQTVQVIVTSANISRLLFEMNARGIPLHHLQIIDELTASFGIHQRKFPDAVSITESCGGKIENSIPATGSLLVKWILRRPVLLFGCVLILMLTFFLPTRVLFVTVSGNERIPQLEILAEAAECGVGFGASRKEIRSEKVKNRLLSALPELQWVGVNTEGCVAHISVRERSLSDSKGYEPMIGSIVASADGVIRELTVISGNPICRVGQAVRKGQLLVSGYSDCGRCIYGTKAEAEVYAKTKRSLHLCMLTEGLRKESAQASKRKYGLIIGKKRINFYKGSGISDTSCVRMYMEYPLTLPGGFRLPVTLAVQEEIDYHNIALKLEDQVVEATLKEYAHTYLQQQMVAGKVEQEDCQIMKENGAIHLIGQYICDEMIGQTRSEEIIIHHEQTG